MLLLATCQLKRPALHWQNQALIPPMEREAATLINHTRTTPRIAVLRSPWDGGTPAVPSGDAVLPRLMRHLEASGSDVLEKDLASDGMDSRSYPHQIAEMALCRGPC